jgi:concentrative nucleoside transporter, CNT family
MLQPVEQAATSDFPRTRIQDDDEINHVPTQDFPRTRIQDSDDEVTEPMVAAQTETVAGEPIERVSPMDAAILGAIDGLKMAVTIAAVLILILGLVSLINQSFGALAALKNSDVVVLQAIGQFFSIVTLQNILGALFLPLTALTGVSLEWNELWQASVIIGRRLFETAIPPYQTLGDLGSKGLLDNRTILIVSYALSGFAHLASVGIFVGGTIALIPSRRKDITELGWKALFVGTLATIMIACVAGVFDTGDYSSILGERKAPVVAPSPTPSPTAGSSPTVSPTVSPTAPVASPTVLPTAPTTPSPQATAVPARPVPQTTPRTPSPVTPRATISPRLQPTPTPTAGRTPASRPQ